MLPRPDLAALGITHRRIPILAIGKDIYCDSAAAVDALEGLSSALRSSPADKAFEAYGNSLIGVMLRSVDVDSMPGLVQDRATIFSMQAFFFCFFSFPPRLITAHADTIN